MLWLELPALRSSADRRVHLRWRAPRGPGLDHRPRRARLRRGLGLREPGRADDRAMVPRVRLPALADGPPRHLDRHGRRDRPVTRLADRQIEIVLRNRVQFGVGAIERLPEVVAAAGGSRVFVVTDPGVRGSGVIERVLGVLAAAGLETAVFAEVEPNPGASTVERGADALRGFGLSRHGRRAGRWRLVDGHGQGARPARRERPGRLGPGVRRPRPDPRPARGRRPDDGRHGRRDELVRGHHRRDGRPQGLHRPSVTAARRDDPRPGPDRRPAAGRDGRDRDRRDDPFARVAPVGQPEPVRRGDGARRHPHDRHLASGGRRRRIGSRGALADAARLAPGRGGAGERDRRRAGPRAWSFDRDAWQGRPRDRARLRPARGPSLLPRDRDRELALVGIALDVASGAESEATALPSRSAPSTSSCATSTSGRPCADSAWPPTRRSISSSSTRSTTRPSATRHASRPRPRCATSWPRSWTDRRGRSA